ncbi:MAG: hypothetical protein MI919_03015 [Holophagales bacterium]|nr:hypothetical protein [Holophagales bacterium]
MLFEIVDLVGLSDGSHCRTPSSIPMAEAPGQSCETEREGVRSMQLSTAIRAGQNQGGEEADIIVDPPPLG